MLKNEIINAIEQRISSAKKKDYSIWTIGITDNPKERKEQHKNEGKDVQFWLEWKTESEADARDIEKYFISKGVNGGTGGITNATFVYIF